MKNFELIKDRLARLPLLCLKNVLDDFSNLEFVHPA